MGEYLQRFRKDCWGYYKQVRRADEKRLNVQMHNCLLECKRLLTMLKRKKRFFGEQIKFINEKIMPYVRRMKWLPPSYQGMMNEWEMDYVDLRGKK